MPLDAVILKSANWFRLVLLLFGPIREALLNILHDSSYGLPRPPADLFKSLSKPSIKLKLSNLRKKGILKKNQWELIFPIGKQETNSNLFDVTIIVLLIEVCTTLWPANSNWRDKNPPLEDISVAAFVIRARELRNYLQHFPSTDQLDNDEFQIKWKDGIDILIGLSYSGSMTDANELKYITLDPKNNIVFRSMLIYLQVQQEKLLENIKENSKSFATLSSVPAELQNIQLRVNHNTEITQEMKSNFEEVMRSLELIKKQINIPARELSSNDMVLPKALEIVASMIGNDWESLSNRMGINRNLKKPIDNMFQWNKQTISEYLLENQKLFSWIQLYDILEALNRKDIIDEVVKDTFLTEGLQKLCYDLIKHYENILSTWNVAKPIRGNSGREYRKKKRKEAYVDLTMGVETCIDEDIKYSDGEYFLRTHNLPCKIVEPNELVQEEDHLIVIRGIAGIGKTSFVDSFILKWINGEVIKDIDYLVKLSCRELNRLRNIESLDDLLQQKFPRIFNSETVQSLSYASKKLLIIIDGFDELKNNQLFAQLSKGKEINSPLISAIYDLIQPRSSIFPGKRVIVCGRPHSCDMIIKAFGEQVPIKVVEISGFNLKNINTFIEIHFQNNNHLIKSLKLKLIECAWLKTMAKIPIFLLILCNIFESESNIEYLNTNTKLYIAACLVFLREHTREYNGKELREYTLMDICNDDEMLETLRQLAVFSYQSLKYQIIIFPEKHCENLHCMEVIENSGIIEKLEGGEDGNIFQFTHLVLEEFLAALHIFIKDKRIGELHTLEHLRNCLPIVAGLEGLLLSSCNAPEYMKSFVRNLCKTTKSNPVIDLHAENYLNNGADFESFLSMFYEYQGNICNKLQRKFFTEEKLNIRLRFHHTLRNLIYFLNKVTIVINELVINMSDGSLSLMEMRDLAPHAAVSKRLVVLKTYISPGGYAYISSKICNKRKESKILLQENNSVTPSDCIQDIIQPQNVHLKELYLFSGGIDFSCIATLQTCIPFLSKLELSGNKDINPESMRLLADIILEAINKDNSCINTLNIHHCNVDIEGINEFQKCIPFLENLSFRHNNLSTESMEIISNIITETEKNRNFRIKQLDFTGCHLTDNHIKSLLPSIGYLQKLYLRWNNNLTCQSVLMMVKHMSKVIEKNPSHHKVIVYVNGECLDGMVQKQLHNIEQYLVCYE